MKADAKQDDMDMECIIPVMVQKVKSLIKAEVCMKFYEDTKLLYLETDASGISLGAALLQHCLLKRHGTR